MVNGVLHVRCLAQPAHAAPMTALGLLSALFAAALVCLQWGLCVCVGCRRLAIRPPHVQS